MWGYKAYPLEKIHFRPVWGNIFLKSNSSIYYSISKGGREGFVCLDLTSEKAMATHSSTLAWKIPGMAEPGRLQSMGSRRVRHDWATSLSLFTFMHWRRKWESTPVFLPGESQGWGELGGLLSMGSHTVEHDWSDLAAAAAAAAAAADLTLLQVNSLLCLWCYQ